MRSRETVLWIDRASVFESRPNRVIAYCEGNVEMAAGRRPGGASLKAPNWLGHLSTAGPVQVRVATVAGKPDVLPPVYSRADGASQTGRRRSMAQPRRGRSVYCAGWFSGGCSARRRCRDDRARHAAAFFAARENGKRSSTGGCRAKG